MKRFLLPALVLVLVLAAVGAASPAATSSARGRASAERKAQRLLNAYVPPQGAVRLHAVPKGEHVLASGAGGTIGERVVRHRLWYVHLPAKAFVRLFFHRLHGWHAIAYGTSYGHSFRHRLVMSTAVTYAEPGFGGRVTGRMLSLVASKSHRAGWSLLRAGVVLVWRLSAAELEYLPAGVREIDIRGPHAKARVTNPDQVRTIVRWFNHLPLDEAPGGGLGCGPTSQQNVTFTFRGRHGTIARMSVPSGGCSPARYTIPRQWQTGLSAGDIDRRVQKLLGVRFMSASR
jgi:hypothetical protein